LHEDAANVTAMPWAALSQANEIVHKDVHGAQTPVQVA
jgi:hypothetical protein